MTVLEQKIKERIAELHEEGDRITALIESLEDLLEREKREAIKRACRPPQTPQPRHDKLANYARLVGPRLSRQGRLVLSALVKAEGSATVPGFCMAVWNKRKVPRPTQASAIKRLNDDLATAASPLRARRAGKKYLLEIVAVG